MSYLPFDVDPIIDRLKVAIPELQAVGKTADLSLLKKFADFRTPSLYVVMGDERSQPSATGHAVRGQQIKVKQLVIVNFSVVLALRNYRYDYGKANLATADPIWSKVRESLLGWTPDLDSARPCSFISSKVIGYDPAVLLVSEIYQTQYAIGAK